MIHFCTEQQTLQAKLAQLELIAFCTKYKCDDMAAK